jgi:hypothetical protein
MARPITYAIRLTLSDGRRSFVRRASATGRGGSIATFRTQAEAQLWADALHGSYSNVEVFERSHGRQWPEAREASKADSVSTSNDGESINVLREGLSDDD